jgi:hypothetical protein
VKPAKILRVSLVVLFSAFVILSIGALLFIKLYPAENLLKLVTSGAEEALGRKVEVKGIGWDLGGISLEGLVIHESDESSPVLASVEKASIRFSLLSLLKSEFEVTAISLKKPVCNISFDDKGESNIGRLVSSLSGKKGSGMSAKISKITLTDATLTLANPIPVLAPLAGTYVIDADVYLKEKIEVRDCRLKLPVDRGVVRPDVDIEIFKDDFKITGKAHLENASLLWVYKWGDNVTLPYNLINGTVTNLIITKDYVKGNAKATSTLLGFPKLLHADGYCHVDIAGRTVLIGNTQGNIEKSSFYVESLHFTFDGNLIKFSVNKIAAQVADTMPLLKFMPRKLFGYAEGSLRYASGLYNGTLSVSNAGYDPVQKVISGLTATVTVTNNTFQKTGIPFNFYGNPCALSVASTERNLSRLYVNLLSDRISLDMLNEKLSGANPTVSVPLEILGSINVNQVQYGPYQMGNVQVQYLLSGSTFSIKGFQFYFADGKVSGNGSINMSGERPKASLLLQIERLIVQKAIASSDKFRNRFFGIASGKSTIDFELSSSILQTARGTAEVTIDKGKLVDTGVQNGLGLLLAELKYKLRDLEFNKIYGNIDIRGTNYLINSFIFNSNNVRLKITGSFDQKLVARPLNIQLEFTRDFIQDLPGALTFTLNKYLRGEWYIIPFIMNGDMTNSENVRRAQ